MISIPFFSIETYTDEPTSFDAGIYLLYMTSYYKPKGGVHDENLQTKFRNYFEDFV